MRENGWGRFEDEDEDEDELTCRELEDDAEAGGLAVFAAYGAAAGFDAGLDDGKSEAGAAGFAGARSVHAVERIEDLRERGFGNAGAAVVHGDENPVVFARRRW
jgi:hypothetical protein